MSHDARVIREEVFGPVVCINKVENMDGAGALAVAERLRVGAVFINDSSDVRVDEMPFGGFGRSGVDREGVRFAIDALREPRLIAVRGHR